MRLPPLPNIYEVDETWFSDSNKIKQNFGILVVGSDKCLFCRGLVPEIVAISKKRIPVLILDGEKDKNKNILKRLGIIGFPSIFIVNRHNLVEYGDKLDSKSITQALRRFCNKQCTE